MDTYEQKYKEALEKAKNMINDLRKGEDILAVSELETMFPELAESEDELTWLTKYIEEEAYSLSMDIRDNEDRIKYEKLQKALAWLEKQKEPELSEDLGEYIAELSKQFPEVSFAKLSRIAVRVKNWLENQGEQKEPQVYETEDGEVITYSESEGYKLVKPKFHEGDWVVQGDNILKIRCVGDTYYCFETVSGYVDDMLVSEIDSQFHLWTIKDAKDGDVLFQDLMDGKTFIYNGINPDMAILYSFIICNDGKDVLPYHIGKPNTGIGNIEENKNIIHPATKEQRKLLFQKMEEAGYEWDDEKKELKLLITNGGDFDSKNCEQEHTWSEKDENGLGDALWCCEQAASIAKDENEMGNVWYAKQWLKSLKDRVQPIHKYSDTEKQEMFIKSQRPHFWRPSDEQIGILEEAMYQVGILTPLGSKINGLCEQLKKLREGEL